MVSKRITGSTFWDDLDTEIDAHGGVGHFNDGDLQYAAMSAQVRMKVILRTHEELFEDTITRENATNNFKAVINGNLWDLTGAGYRDVVLGHDPVEAGDTLPIGQVITGNTLSAGSSETERFFIAWGLFPPRLDYEYRFGFGNPPFLSAEAIGGIGPLIISRLKYGTRNVYGQGCPAGAPVTGPPGPTFAPYIVQRSSSQFTAALSTGNTTGKVAVALCRDAQKILLLVQPDDAATGISFNSLRDKLAGVGVDDAVFLDGSDSVLLMIRGSWHIRQGDNKNEGTTTGIGFF
jgi:hypothetical protein